MLNTNSSTEKATAARSKHSKQRSVRSYLRLNIATFALAGLLLAFITFQVGREVAQRLEAQPNTADTSNGANALVVPPITDPFAASNNAGTNDNNSATSNSDGSNGSFSSNGYDNSQNPFANSNSGVQSNSPSYSQPMPFTKHS